MINIKVKRNDLAKLWELPKYGTTGSAAFDLVASEEMILHRGKTYLVPTGMHMEIPYGFEGQIRPRSSLAYKGVVVVNSPGTIDSDYRGEIKIIMETTKESFFMISPGMRIAQMVIAPIMQVEFTDVDELDTSERAEGGFGSTGQ